MELSISLLNRIFLFLSVSVNAIESTSCILSLDPEHLNLLVLFYFINFSSHSLPLLLFSLEFDKMEIR